MEYTIDLALLAEAAAKKQDENESFCKFVAKLNPTEVDAAAHRINDSVSAGIDCTQCANCCKTLVIEAESDECRRVAAAVGQSEEQFLSEYIEVSLAGKMYLNTHPCKLLSNNKCTVYASRFADCRDFPHLHKSGFAKRAPLTIMYFGACPIIYHVTEQLKQVLNFFD
jgi:uncharacterized protein